MIIGVYSVVLEVTLKMLKHTEEMAERNCVGFLSAEELFQYKCDKLLIHLSLSSHQRKSRWGLHNPVLCQRNCHICLIFKFHVSAQPSVFKTNKKGESSLALDQVLDGSWYPKGEQRCHKGFHPSDRLAAGAVGEPFSSRQSPESSNPNCIFWQTILKRDLPPEALPSRVTDSLL